MDTGIAVSETLSSTAAASTATACVECFVSFGLDPSIAAAAAVVLGVLVRLGADWAQRKLAERRARLHQPSPTPETTP